MLQSFTPTKFQTADEFLTYAKQQIVAQGYEVLTAWQEDNQVAYACSVQFDGTGMYASPKVSYSWRHAHN
jgi:xanthine dehydrogenase molybdopterin-binding subunit B